MDQTRLRRALAARVERQDGHWHWTGALQGGRPTLWQQGVPTSARRLSLELAGHNLPPGVPVFVLCGERLCIAPNCLQTRFLTCGNGHSRTPGERQCGECSEAFRMRRVECPDCGRITRYKNQFAHRKRCPGPPAVAPIIQNHRTPEQRAQLIQDIGEDIEAGITAQRICTLLNTTPGALAKLLQRHGQPELARPFDRLTRIEANETKETSHDNW